ncbi:hypothetical protein GYMLUDRAFT_235880 [Collybiopsis luxurians FD-317 M1]|nr:hypothetical protein GYMLUDRAFT_235880 [Collybiopsis luxurians FD-317 M1]
MSELFPSELVSRILENFSSNEVTLRNCVLVEKAWGCLAQRIIFRSLSLRPPSGTSKNTSNAFLNAMERLSGTRDGVDLLFGAEADFSEETIQSSIAQVIRNLDQVQSLKLENINWGSLSALLRAAFTQLLSTSSMEQLLLRAVTAP